MNNFYNASQNAMDWGKFDPRNCGDDDYEHEDIIPAYECFCCGEIIQESSEVWHGKNPVCYECDIEIKKGN